MTSHLGRQVPFFVVLLQQSAAEPIKCCYCTW